MAKNPTISQLDPGQIIKRVYDEANDQIRTTIDASVNINGQQTLVINDTEDSIKIGDGNGHYLAVNPDGSINTTSVNPSVGSNGATAPTSSTEVGGINPTGKLSPLQVDSAGQLKVAGISVFTSQDVRVLFLEVTGIAVGVETSVNSYTAPAGKISYLLSIDASGENRGQYNIYLNGSLLDKKYSNVTSLTANFDYKTGSGTVPGMIVPIGQTVDIKIINNGNSIASYNGRFLILEATV
jgi:hypothetical protein